MDTVALGSPKRRKMTLPAGDDSDGGNDEGDEEGGKKFGCAPGFMARLKTHFRSHPMMISAGEFEVLDKTWLLAHFKKSVEYKRNVDNLIYLRHSSGVLIVACMGMLMDRLKRPQKYLAHLVQTYGFKRARFTVESAEQRVDALRVFFESTPHFVQSRAEQESYTGCLKVFYSSKISLFFFLLLISFLCCCLKISSLIPPFV